MVARTFVDLKREQIPLRMMNLSTQLRKINKGAELAHCETLAADCTVKMDDGDSEALGAVQALEKDT